MKRDCKTRRRSQDGIALLIAIFVLLLISVVAIALLVSSGTETALGANYRTSSSVYYAALAGLEEARGRLLPRNPNYFGNSVVPPNFPLGQTVYVINRLSGDNIAPWDQSNSFYDKEYVTEFGVEASAVSSWQSVYSIWDNNSLTVPGPIFKWVRINAASEQSLFLQVNSSGYSTSPAIYYDPFHLNNAGLAWPSLVVGPTATSAQALEITAMASLPTGSKKILQYLVAPIAVNLTFPAALTLNGYSDSFTGPNHNAFHIDGVDTGDPACSASGFPFKVPAIWVPDSSDVTTVLSGIPSSKQSNYTGSTPPASVSHLGGSLPTGLQTPQGLDAYIQSFAPYADVRLAGPADQTGLPGGMSPSNPMSVFVQGDFNLTGGFTGYGLLIVTGNFTYTSDSSWNGLVMVVGQGSVSASSNLTLGAFNGAMFIAQTRDTSGVVLAGPTLGSASFSNTGRGNGILYNCALINMAEATLTYKILSFHEIRQ
jgi:hypothetical protein